MKSLSTRLDGRELRFDGISIVQPDRVAEALLRGVHPSKLMVTEVTDEIQLFNDNVDASETLHQVKELPLNLSYRWQLPERYLNLDLHEAVGQAYEAQVEKLLTTYTPQQHDAALDRLAAELDEIERRGMVEFVKTIIYILDVFREREVVWGVGRGSSCASYVLFIIGLHSVDPIRYNVPMNEFFHD